MNKKFLVRLSKNENALVIKAGVSFAMYRLRIGRHLFFLVFALLFSANAFAQLGLRLEVSSRSIGKDEVLQVSYSVQNASELNGRLSVTDFPGWQIVSGPQTSQETSIINGVRSSSIGYVYLLMPQKTGTLSIPGASIVADGKQLTCAGTTIHVSNQSSGRNVPPSGASGGAGSRLSGLQSLLDQLAGNGAEDQPESGNVLHRGETAAQKIKDNMFVRATPSKKTVYVGEPFVVTYQLFSALGGQSRVTAQPVFNGVSVLDLTKDSQPEMVTVGNKRYRAFLVRKVQLTALQSGTVSLGSVETSNEIPFATYDDPYHTQTYTQLLRNPEVTVEAKALPEAGRPADFSGAVGRFHIRATPRTALLSVGENNSLHIEISGEGNLLPATMPQVTWPSGVEHYDPKDSQSVDKRSTPVQVSKVFDVPFIGHKQGKVAFAPIAFSYFDPNDGTYKTIKSDPFTVEFSAPLPTNVDNDNQFGTDISLIAKIVGGLAVALLLILVAIKAAKKNKKKPKKKSETEQQRSDQAAPWNLDKKEKTQPKEPVADAAAHTANTDQPEVAQPVFQPQKNFDIELQKIMLCTDKSEMYALGATAAQEILATYLHVPIQSKDKLLELLQQSSVTETEKQNIAHAMQSLQDQCNRGLYSPLFSESDKLSLIDGLNGLRTWTRI
ncbi:MAG: BatD family protein [Chitinophagaceae bacterium]